MADIYLIAHGVNGAGKSTLLTFIRDKLREIGVGATSEGVNQHLLKVSGEEFLAKHLGVDK